MDCTTFTGESVRLCEAMVASASSFDSLVFDMNSWFLIWAGSCVFFMHLGFAMLSAGAVRVKNTKNILFCIMLDACMCAIGWWLCGWAFAFGEDAGSFIGTTGFVGIGLGEDYTYTDWFFQYAFAATAATIVSGAVAERASFEAYLSYSFLLSIWVYPVIVHFVWGGGFLTLGADSFLGVGAFDFAGDGVIHITGGLAGLIGSYLIGPRRGRFTSDGEIVPMPGHSAPLAMLGTFILWFGWFGFNSGSVLVIVGSGNVAGRAAVNTLLASASGAISSMFYSTWKKEARDWDLGIALNGTLAGLVSITASCAVVETWAAIIIGFGGGILYVLASEFTLVKMRIDDPLDATAVHLFCGAYGLLVTGFFAKSEFMVEVLSDFAESSHKDYSGIFYEGNGSLLAANFVELIVVVAWVTVFIAPYFYFLKRMGWFRISADHEAIGIDESSHGGNAYPEHFNDEVFKPTKEQNAQEPVVDAKTVPPTAAEAEAEATTSTSADNGALQQV